MSLSGFLQRRKKSMLLKALCTLFMVTALEWLTNRREDCPICRVQMVTEEEMVASMALGRQETTTI
jgi:hypothetical protein